MSSKNEASIDVEAAIESPDHAFDSPYSVVHAADLTLAEKLAVLKRWEQSEVDLERAADEGMGGRRPSRLDDINKALLELDPTNDGAEQLAEKAT